MPAINPNHTRVNWGPVRLPAVKRDFRKIEKLKEQGQRKDDDGVCHLLIRDIRELSISVNMSEYKHRQKYKHKQF